MFCNLVGKQNTQKTKKDKEKLDYNKTSNDYITGNGSFNSLYGSKVA